MLQLGMLCLAALRLAALRMSLVLRCPHILGKLLCSKQRLSLPFLQVMSVVKSLASHGITICATIHSPTPYTFNLFDRLLLLLKGRVVYFGPNGALIVNVACIALCCAAALRCGEHQAALARCC